MPHDFANALEELSKTGGKAIDVTDKVVDLIIKVIGPLSEKTGQFLGQRFEIYFRENLEKIADKVKERSLKRSLNSGSRPIPTRVAIPLLQAASLEDDEILREIWANLITNSIDPNFEETIHPGYIEVVKQLSPDEAVILTSFIQVETYPIVFSDHIPPTYSDLTQLLALQNPAYKAPDQISYQTICHAYLNRCQNLNLKKHSDALVYLDNLLRLRIVELGHNFSGDNKLTAFDSSVTTPARNEFLKITPFGQSIIKACLSE